MTSRRKFTLAGLGVALGMVAAPVIWSAFSSHAYFYEGRCVGGHDIYVRLLADGYFSYSPGHGVPEHRRFRIRRALDGWEVLGLPHSEEYWSPLEGENRVIGYLRLRGGGLEQTFDAGKNWQWYPRVYNIWRVWAVRLYERLPDLRVQDFRPSNQK